MPDLTGLDSKMTDAPMGSDAHESATARNGVAKFRWKSGVGLLAVGVVAQAICWFSLDQTYRIFALMAVCSATLLLLFLWWAFFSGLRRRTRLVGVLILASVAGLLSQIIRRDGVRGDMTPILAFRWNPSPEQTAAAYWRGRERDDFSESPDPDYFDMVSTDETGAIAPLEITEDDWPGFRGSRRDSVVSGVTLRQDWEYNPPRLLWRHPVGPGWSSFAVVDRFAFTQEQRGQDEAVVCYDLENGEEIWQHLDPDVSFSEPMGGVGPRATPTVYDSKVYALGSKGMLNCLEARTGERIWSTNILQDSEANNLHWAMAGSPLVFDDLVVVNPGGKRGRALTAYDRLNGEIRWSAGDHQAGYAAPRLETIAGVSQVLIFDGHGLAGHSVADGEELWRFPWSNSQRINATQPIVVDDGLVIVGTGYGKGSVLVEVGLADGKWSLPTSRWDTKRLKLKFSDAVVREGFLYGLDENVLTCFDWKTGERMWKRGRYGYGQLMLVGDVLLIQSESGEVALVEAIPDAHREIARFPALDGKTWNHPVLAHGKLLVRNAAEAACYDLGL